MNNLHRVLGYGGLIPFIGLAMFYHYPDELMYQLIGTEQSPIGFWLVSYAALIYSFIGGVYWSISLQKNYNNLVPLLLLSIFMMLWAWLWILKPALFSPWIMALSFWLLPIIEYRWLKGIMNDDFRKMRLHLSIIAGLSLMSLSL